MSLSTVVRTKKWFIMTDQTLVVIHYFPFLVEHFPTPSKKLAILEKISVLASLYYFSSQTWLIGIIYLNLHKMKSPKMFRGGLLVENIQILVAGLHKIAISRPPKPINYP